MPVWRNCTKILATSAASGNPTCANSGGALLGPAAKTDADKDPKMKNARQITAGENLSWFAMNTSGFLGRFGSGHSGVCR